MSYPLDVTYRCNSAAVMYRRRPSRCALICPPRMRSYSVARLMRRMRAASTIPNRNCGSGSLVRVIGRPAIHGHVSSVLERRTN